MAPWKIECWDYCERAFRGVLSCNVLDNSLTILLDLESSLFACRARLTSNSTILKESLSADASGASGLSSPRLEDEKRALGTKGLLKEHDRIDDRIPDDLVQRGGWKECWQSCCSSVLPVKECLPTLLPALWPAPPFLPAPLLALRPAPFRISPDSDSVPGRQDRNTRWNH